MNKVNMAVETERYSAKRYSAKGYLIGAIFTLILSAFYSIQAWPLFLKWFVPFPTLAETTVYEGTLHIKGLAHSNKFGNVAPAYYIVSKDGPHKIFWGYPGSEMESFDHNFEGIKGKVWYHPIFGVVQEEFVANSVLMEISPSLKKQPNFGNKYETGSYDVFMHHFNYENYEWALLTPCVGFMLSIYYFIQYRRLKQLQGVQKGLS